jgi:hypothetical protein
MLISTYHVEGIEVDHSTPVMSSEELLTASKAAA